MFFLNFMRDMGKKESIYLKHFRNVLNNYFSVVVIFKILNKFFKHIFKWCYFIKITA